MDKLDEIFAMQSSLDNFISDTRNLRDGRYSKSDWMQKKAIALIAEVTELMDEINYKWWKNEKPIDEHAVKEELTDVLHFFVSMCLEAGMTADELYAIYCDKNKENVKRQQGLSDKKGYEPEKK